MKKVFVINGSPRPAGNTSYLVKSFKKGAEYSGAGIKQINAHELDIKYCNGCLRCNLIKRCSIDDSWTEISKDILESDVLVFASPIYFHHVTAQMKKIIDRFRSFVKVTMTEESINHTPWQYWEKDFVLLLTLGSSSDEDAQAVIKLFKFITEILGEKNKLHIIVGTRLGVIKQISLGKEALEKLYTKLELPSELAENDVTKNRELLRACYDLGKEICEK